MNTQTTVTIKMDKKLRDDAKKTAKRMGIPFTTAMNAMARKFVREGMLVLEVECPFPSHTPNAETRKAIREVEEYKAGKRTLRSFATTEQMFADILGTNWRAKA